MTFINIYLFGKHLSFVSSVFVIIFLQMLHLEQKT